MTTYSELLQTLHSNEYQNIIISDDWAQGRACFGGLVAALLFKACKNAVNDSERKVRNVQTTFVGPVAPNEETRFVTTILRAGGSTTSVECKVVQSGQVQSTMIASFGKSRASSHSIAPAIALPAYPHADELKLFPYAQGITPEFVQHFNMAWAEGSPPFNGDKSKTMGGWCQFKEQVIAADEGDVLTLIDSWPPIAIQMLDKFSPVSTLNWSVQFIQELPELSCRDWYQYRVEALQGDGGYSNTLAHFWSDEGELLAISTQTVAVFA
jgi:acyl-CoA thioesterase